MRIRLLSILALLAMPSAAIAQNCPTRASWPTAEWPSRIAETAAARGPEIAALEQYLFTLVGRDADRKGIRTDGVVIIQGGNLVYEKYGRGFTASNRHLGWSVTKSVVNALAGIAIGHGVMTLDSSVCDFYPGTPEDHCAITARTLLEWNSGLDWKEVYENESNQQSSVLAMLYGMGHRDRAAFVLGHPLIAAPGTRHDYSTGDATLLAGMVTKAAEPSLGHDWMYSELFDKVGMRSTTFERDQGDTPTGGSYFYATPRDMAKFGWLFLNDGCWNGDRILPENWVHDTNQLVRTYITNAPERDPLYVPGRSWWLNIPVPEINLPAPYPDAPADTVSARGHWGQSITYIPSLDMVIVRVGDDRETGVMDFNRFLELAIAVGRAP